MHNGVSARVLAHVEVAAPVVNLGRGEMAFLTRDLELGGAVVARDAASAAAARGALVFEPAHDMTLAAAHNRIGLHHWSDPDAVLARGATEAWLRDPDRTIGLMAGDILILVEERDPETGRAADADPAHRQGVRLIRDPEAVLDPLEEVSPGTLLQVLRVVWGPEDALGFELSVGERLRARASWPLRTATSSSPTTAWRSPTRSRSAPRPRRSTRSCRRPPASPTS